MVRMKARTLANPRAARRVARRHARLTLARDRWLIEDLGTPAGGLSMACSPRAPAAAAGAANRRRGRQSRPPAGASRAGAVSARPGRYDVGPVIARGGMGEVRQATDTRIHRTVAMKVMHGPGPGG